VLYAASHKVPAATEQIKFLSSLRFEVAWKRGIESRPAEVLSPFALTEGPIPGKQLLSAVGMGSEYESEYAVYGLVFSGRITSRTVPLTDHLVISVFNPDQHFLARMAIALTSPPFRVPVKR
jgi:hypothetical protein